MPKIWITKGEDMKTQQNEKSFSTNRRALLKYTGVFATLPFASYMLDKGALLAAGIKGFKTDFS